MLVSGIRAKRGAQGTICSGCAAVAHVGRQRPCRAWPWSEILTTCSSPAQGPAECEREVAHAHPDGS